MIVLRRLLSQVRIGMLTPWAYRARTLLSFVLLAVQVALFSVLWRALYAGREGDVRGADVETAVGYAVLGLTVAAVLHTSPFWSIEARVREGLIGVDLTRPLGLLAQSLAAQMGYVVAMLPAVVFGLVAGLLLNGLAPPTSGADAVAFVISLVLACAVAQLTTLLMSLSSFWTLEIGGITMAFSVVRTFMSGAIMPLWFMPGWLQTLAGALPFQASTYTPIAVYFGRPPGGLAAALGVQILWVVILAGLCGWVWSRAKLRVIVQGG